MIILRKFYIPIEKEFSLDLPTGSSVVSANMEGANAYLTVAVDSDIAARGDTHKLSFVLVSVDQPIASSFYEFDQMHYVGRLACFQGKFELFQK